MELFLFFPISRLQRGVRWLFVYDNKYKLFQINVQVTNLREQGIFLFFSQFKVLCCSVVPNDFITY